MRKAAVTVLPVDRVAQADRVAMVLPAVPVAMVLPAAVTVVLLPAASVRPAVVLPASARPADFLRPALR